MEKFLSNQSKTKFIDQIKKSLDSCDEFFFSVSFIKYAGLYLIRKEIEAALLRGAIGRLITSTYQNFTDIKSLEYLVELSVKFSNFECHIDHKNFKSQGFHTKGYLFVREDTYETIIGSSNITRFALLHNHEWNTSVTHKDKSDLYDEVMNEFNDLWNKTMPITSEIIENYHMQLEYAIQAWDMDYYNDISRIEPNLMQKSALKELRRLRNLGEKKALVIAATGSGKTYLAAFDAYNFDASSVLFVCHRENILNDAMITFKKVFGNNKTMSIYSGNSAKENTEFVFSTNVMMTNHLHDFDRHQFQYIIIDEVHHAVASTYQKILNYFDPEFLIGLTATPERLDKENVFSIFENNVPYELRLKDALELDLVVPFHYYGIKDDFFEYDDKNRRYLIDNTNYQNNILYISEKIENYRRDKKSLAAIAFCSSVDQANKFSNSFDDLGYKTISLTGESSIQDRINAFQNLQSEDNVLDIIFTVDILNEGIDIPGIDMVLFLRPTESPTIFIQQLGRGLRKYYNKPYLTVLDFIGNSYSRSVQIALAVGSITENIVLDKITLRDYIQNGFSGLPSDVRIEFDEKSKEEILSSINKTNFNSAKFLISDYNNIKKYRKQTSYLKQIDLLDSEIVTNPYRFIKYKGCYYNFLKTAEKIDSIPTFSDNEVQLLKYLTSMLPLVRPYEFLILRRLLESTMSSNELIDYIKYDSQYHEEHYKYAIKNLMDLLSRNQSVDKILIKYEEDRYSINFNQFNTEFVEFIKDIIDFGIEEYNINFGVFTGDFILHKKYFKEQTTLMYLTPTIYTPVQGIVYLGNDANFYINLIKREQEDPRLKYADHFTSDKILEWESQNNTTFENSKGKELLSYQKARIFVRQYDQQDGQTMPFTYLGYGRYTKVEKTSNVNQTLKITLELENALPLYLQAEFMNLEDKDEKDS